MDVLFEDEHLLVVNKPAGLPTMGKPAADQAAPGSHDHATDSLLRRVRKYLHRATKTSDPIFAGFIGRLDAPVSGLCLVARTPTMAHQLTDQFRQGRGQRIYWALVEEPPDPTEGRLTHWLLPRLRPRRVEIVAPNTTGAKRAELTYQTRPEALTGLTLVEVQIQTGRKHQIRAQLSAAGCPIAGDRKYGSTWRYHRQVGIGLHARRIEFEHPQTHQRFEFTAPCPDFWNFDTE